MKKMVIKGSLSVILLMFLTSFGADTSKPERRTIWSKIQAARVERQKRRAKRSVSLKLIKYRVEQNDIIIDSLVQNKIDSLKKQ